MSTPSPEYSHPTTDAPSPPLYTPSQPNPNPNTPRRLDFLASPILQTLLADLCLSICAYSIYCLLLTFDTFNAFLDEELEWICSKIWDGNSTTVGKGVGTISSIGIKYFAVGGGRMIDEGKLAAICSHPGWTGITTLDALPNPIANHWIVLFLLLAKTFLAYTFLTRSRQNSSPSSTTTKPLDYLLFSIASHAFLSLFLFASRIDYTPLATLGMDRKEFIVGVVFWVVVAGCVLVGMEGWCKGFRVSWCFVPNVKVDEKGALIERDEKMEEVSFWNKVDLVQIVVQV